MQNKPNILVLCTGNSCRSQMAEGYFREFAGDRFNLFSAGTNPQPEVHPLAIRAMAEDGIDISGHRPTDLKEYLGHLSVRNLVVVCNGANDSCPRIWPGMGERLYWPFDDPAQFQGSEAETFDEFVRVRDEIKERILAWLETNQGA